MGTHACTAVPLDIDTLDQLGDTIQTELLVSIRRIVFDPIRNGRVRLFHVEHRYDGQGLFDRLARVRHLALYLLGIAGELYR